MKSIDEQFREILAGIHNHTADVQSLNTRLDERRKIIAIVGAYDLARADPQFKCPSYLMAAIEAARE